MKQKSTQHETFIHRTGNAPQNISDNCIHSVPALVHGADSRSLLPLTPYEKWQYEKYGNFYSEKTDEQVPNEMDHMFIMPHVLYNY